MHAAQARVRGVVCKFCGKPIQLSPSILKRVILVQTETTVADLTSKVFPARCRACRVEAIYSLDQIAQLHAPEEQAGS
jgi:hypothetical protein